MPAFVEEAKMANDPENKEPRRRELIAVAAKGGVIGLAGMLCGRLLMLSFQVIVSRLYGPGYFGMFITGLLLLQLSEIIAGLGLQKGGMRFLAIACEKKDIAAIRNVLFAASVFPMAASVAMGALLYFFAPFLADTCFRDAAMTDVIRLFSFSTPFFTLLRFSSELSRAFKTVKYSVMIEDIGFPFLQVAVFVALQCIRPGFPTVIHSFIISAALCSILMHYKMRRQVKRFLMRFDLGVLREARLSSRNWREILIYSLPIMPMGLLLIANHFADILMLNVFMSSGSVGVYAAASKWTLFFVMLMQPVLVIFGPLIASQYGVNRRRQVRVLYKTASRWLFLLSLPIFIFIFLGSGPLMSLFGKDFAGTGPKIVMILIIGSLFNSVRGVAGLLLSMVGLQRIELLLVTCALLLNVFLNILLIPAYGCMGAAWATTASIICLDTVRMAVVWKYYQVWPFSARFIIPSVAAVMASVFGLMLGRGLSSSWLSVCAVSALAAFAVLVVSAVAGFSRSDRRMAMGLINRFKKRKLASVAVLADGGRGFQGGR
jgi:O-antigen/teichoic acid export membrane protein